MKMQKHAVLIRSFVLKTQRLIEMEIITQNKVKSLLNTLTFVEELQQNHFAITLSIFLLLMSKFEN